MEKVNVYDEFWDAFIAYADSHIDLLPPSVSVRDRKRLQGRSYFDVNSGYKYWHFSLQVNLRSQQLRALAYLGNRQELFDTFLANRIQLEERLGARLGWSVLDKNQTAQSVGLITDFSIQDEENWDVGFDWLLKSMQRLGEVLGPLSDRRD